MSGIETVPPRASLEARPLHVSDRGAAVAHLATRPRDNLLLIDLAERIGEPPAPGEMPAELIAVWNQGGIVSIAGLRPSLVLEPVVEPESLAALRPYLDSLGVGLLKSPLPGADLLWRYLTQQRSRRALVDRIETAYAVQPDSLRPAPAPEGALARNASRSDLEALIVAARESLREEGRPDPFAGDAKGFRRWVRGRLARARVVEAEGRVVFVGYADVQREEGWLLQGVYTWPDVRRKGFAALGVSALCDAAFAAGAEHVQLAVVEGNQAGRRLYESLGFEPFAKLRTVLFT